MANQTSKSGRIASSLTALSTVCSGAALCLYWNYGTNKLCPEILMPCVVSLAIALVLGLFLTAAGVAGKNLTLLTYVLYLAGLAGFAEYIVSQLNYIANVFYGVDGNSFTPTMIATALTALLGWLFSLTAAVMRHRAACRRNRAAQDNAMKKYLSTNRWTKVCAWLSTILVIAMIATQTVASYAPVINSTLSTATSRITGLNEDAVYYPKEYTDAKAAAEYINQVYREAEAEGLVLLKNEGGSAPISEGSSVSLFGTASTYINCSTQGVRNNDDKTNYPTLRQALEADGVSVNEELWDFYASGAGAAFGVTRTSINEVPWNRFPVELQNTFTGDAAIVVLTRENGEGEDQMVGGFSNTEDGSYLSISTEERELLVKLTSFKAKGKFGKVILLLNSALNMQVDFLNDPAIDVDTVMWIGNTGSSGIYAVADALVGKANPSGRLSTTFVKDNLSSPAMASWAQNFGMTITQQFEGEISSLESSQFNYYAYAEGIYIGYRYYETRYEDVLMGTPGAGDYVYSDNVAYPFGYGLSYTSFDYSDFAISQRPDGDYDVTVTVTNTGAVDGKHAVQVYLQKPYTAYDVEYGVEKASVELAGFTKTGMLAPGEAETVTVTIDKSLFASYDSNGTETYILDVGSYYLAVGTDAHDALNNIMAAKGIAGLTDYLGNETAARPELAAVALEQEQLDVTTYAVSAETGAEIFNQLDSADMNRYDGAGTNRVEYVSRSNWEGTFPKRNVTFTMNKYLLEDLQNITTSDFARKAYPRVRTMPSLGENGELTIAALRGAEITDPRWEQLMDQIPFGNMNRLLTTAICNTAGISSVAKPETKEADGPAYVKDTNVAQGGEDTGCRLPCEGILASTFNQELLQRVGEAFGVDAQVSGVNGIYAPGMNIQRTAFGGRNSEYYSEDPVLSGLAAMYEIRGIQSKGIIAYAKHFAFNEQDTHRDGAGVWFNEQAAREIMLRPFEYAVRPSMGNAHAVMSAFIRIGATWVSAHEGLITQILRNEWGFDGFVITDYAGGGLQYMTLLDGIMGGTDCWLLNGEMSFAAFENDPTVVSAMRGATKRILYTISNFCDIMNGMDNGTRVEQVIPWWQAIIYAMDAAFGALLLASVVMLGMSMKRKKP